MIDDLASRAAMTAAAFLILATGVSLLEMSDGNAVRDAAERLAIHLARQLDAIGTMDAEVVFRGGDAPFSLPPALAGSPYRVEVRRADLRVYSGGLFALRGAPPPREARPSRPHAAWAADAHGPRRRDGTPAAHAAVRARAVARKRTGDLAVEPARCAAASLLRSDAECRAEGGRPLPNHH